MPQETSRWSGHLGNQNWRTPKYFFDIIQKNFDIELDACTTEENPLNCKNFYTPKDDGLNCYWKTWTYCNPPYGQSTLWVKKAVYEMNNRDVCSILLLPANTETNWFHDCIWNKYKDEPQKGITVKFIHKRLFFVGAVDPAKFPNILVIFHNEHWKNKYINLSSI